VFVFKLTTVDNVHDEVSNYEMSILQCARACSEANDAFPTREVLLLPLCPNATIDHANRRQYKVYYFPRRLSVMPMGVSW
jgi:hypothetical protein